LFVGVLLHTGVGGGSQIGCNFVKVFMQMLIASGNEVGYLARDLHFVSVVKQVVLFVGALMNFVIARDELV
jgi:hypothetical protein